MMPVEVRQSDGVFTSERTKMIWVMSASLPTDIFQHQHMDFSLLVVPINVHAKVFLAVPILRALVVYVKNVEQVLGVFSANVFHAKIADAEREEDGS
jgi:hypothetical protein